jgi:Histidine kinase-, DNA gyrase B-, and HSP90-like ATPase
VSANEQLLADRAKNCVNCGRWSRALIELSKYVLEALWRDAEFILYRGRGKDYPSQVFVLSPVAEYPAPASLKRLEHEYSFKEDLDSNWAVRPIAIARHSERTVLVTEDPGGVPLDQLFGRGLDLALSLRLAVGLSVAIEVVAMTSSLVERNRISLHTQLASDLPLVFGDRIQLQQVILNLLINAVEALSRVVEGPRELWVSSKKVPGTASESTTESQFTHVAIAVRDSGPGLDPKIMNRIFDAFFTTKTTGLGMGLAISQSIIQAHGGRLWADAIPSGGSIFQFALPIDDERGHDDRSNPSVPDKSVT